MSGRYDNPFVPRAGDKQTGMLECLDGRKLERLPERSSLLAF